MVTMNLLVENVISMASNPFRAMPKSGWLNSMELTKRCFICILNRWSIASIIGMVIYILICWNYAVITLFNFLSPNVFYKKRKIRFSQKAIWSANPLINQNISTISKILFKSATITPILNSHFFSFSTYLEMCT